MRHETILHLDRAWEVTIPEVPGDVLTVRFRSDDVRDPKTYEAGLSREELEDDGQELELALRRGLESALVLDALAGREAGLTAEEVGSMVRMPVEAVRDRLEVLEEVQPLLDLSGPRRYRTLDGGSA